MEFLASLLKHGVNVEYCRILVKNFYHKCVKNTHLIFHLFKQHTARCDLCNNLSNGELLCQTCQQDIPHFRLPQGANNLLLWPAIDKIFPKRKFDRLLCYAPYVWPYDVWLKQFKYNARFEIAPLLAQLLTASWQEHLKHFSNSQWLEEHCLITSVPIHFSKWKTRGFNQAHLIAKKFAKVNKLPYQPNLLSRIKKGDSQVGQSGAFRRKNLSNAFEINKVLLNNAKYIIVIDDVITTGTTVNEISKILKNHGVEQVLVMTIALSLPTKN
ncbi:ComF family protein [Thalassotalea profundi]|uniref:Competence protein F n=1 Tax=Thalassotalea profundi TaxID=2036687 RepID=A0ABQ3IZY5_9GAMM|nr:ComF family protein [Thalassotalea profundi]GHE96850.1 competence protein F [Thalassotalea profundi]